MSGRPPRKRSRRLRRPYVNKREHVQLPSGGATRELVTALLGACKRAYHGDCPGLDDVRGRLVACSCACHARDETGDPVVDAVLALSEQLFIFRGDVLGELNAVGERLERIETRLPASTSRTRP